MNWFGKITLGFAALTICSSQPLHAETLDLTAPVSPNIYTGYALNVSYTAESLPITSPNFTVNSSAGVMYNYVYDQGGDSYNIAGGTVSMSADVTETSAVIASATNDQITITGHLLDGTHNALNLTLLTGTLTHIGMQNNVPGDVINALFDVTGGLLDPSFGLKGGIILTLSPDDSVVSFGNSFSSGSASVADIFAVPSPAAVWSGLLLISGMIAVRSRRVTE